MKYSAMSVSSVGSRESECLLGKHQARLGQGASVNDRFIRVRGQVRSSGGDTTARVRQGYDPPPLSSPRSRMLVVSPPLLEYRQWQLLGLTTTTYTSHWSLWVICCLQKYFGRDGNSCNNTTLISLSGRTAQYH